MSLFPAYGGDKPSSALGAKETKESEKVAGTTSGDWKNNESFAQKDIVSDYIPTPVPIVDSSSSSEDSADEESPQTTNIVIAKTLEFDANDGFYVDKKSNKVYLTLKTLTKPARPRYKIRMRRLRDTDYKPRESSRSLLSSKKVRYSWKQPPDPNSSKEEIAKLQEQLIQTKVLVQREPKVVDHWLQLHRLLDLNLDKANRLAVAEHQLHSLELALEHHPSNEKILRLYTDVANATYPASEVAARFEKMLEDNPYEYALWTALIMATQGNMARCSVPAVLQTYAYSMRRMQVGYTDEHIRIFATHTDQIMLSLFHNCALFLRQTGKMNMMFAMMRLCLELNFPDTTFSCFEAKAASEGLLIEYEEEVLRSDMPMSKIWTRIEQLRQAYCYLPYPQLMPSAEDAVAEGLDPQRCVFNEDVMPYAHALKSQDNRLHLLLIVVQLTKLPLVRSACLAAKMHPRTDEFGESEAIETLFAELADRHSYALPTSYSAAFDAALVDLAKEMSVSPSFMPHFLGHDLYEMTISELLLTCSSAVRMEESRRRIFMVLWLRFHRFRVVLHRLMGKLTKVYIKQLKDSFRSQMRLPENRDVTRFYTEVAMFEFEALESEADGERVFSIFSTIFLAEAQKGQSFSCPDLMHAYLVCAEMLIRFNRRTEAIHLLFCLCVRQHTDKISVDAIGVEECLRSANKLLQEECALLDTLPATMTLEEYFQPNKLLILLRARCLLCVMHQNYLDGTCEDLLAHPLTMECAESSERRRFLREQVMEVLILQYQMPLLVGTAEQEGRAPVQAALNAQLAALVECGLKEFPRNMVMLQCLSNFRTMLWPQQRGHFIRTQAGIVSLLHLVITAQCRFRHSLWENGLLGAGDENAAAEQAMRNRFLSMFETFLPTNPNRSEMEKEQYRFLRRNSLFWRLYLRRLSDTRTSFERSKDCLLAAMDECPWDKALLLEGATYVPQEFTHLQDVMTEKELGIYALPEELDILRQCI
ncbi:nuclear exosome regulator NRDE2 [Drosophila ficusphila]|uniref:nuclear exosome regulator NRDE2 n=1 Tax=Drosophila ficusphila TaxID=30025 RepID=UPI0007E6D9E1|nr:nuclear exosome regulator NRDE2 [Drosophila ficusphila]